MALKGHLPVVQCCIVSKAIKWVLWTLNEIKINFTITSLSM